MKTVIEMIDLVRRLKKIKIAAPPEHPVHPKICDEAAICILDLLEWRIKDEK